MTPNTTDPASTQPTIHNFFSPTSSAVRDSLSSGLDIPMTPRRSILGDQSDRESEGEDDDGMDILENRKRGRGDDSMKSLLLMTSLRQHPLSIFLTTVVGFTLILLRKEIVSFSRK